MIVSVNDPTALEQAKDILSKGGLIIYPTDTLYGFGVDATNEAALKRLETVKGRGGPWSVLVPNAEDIRPMVTLSADEFSLVRPYLTGHTTVILPVRDQWVHTAVAGPGSTVGIRIPDHRFCQQLSLFFDRPITTTSVNRTGQKPMNSIQQINAEFGSAVDLIIDEGTLPPSSGSTVYRWEQASLIRIRN
ncbi:MAG: threonylcarbamoyl-AMP synthase [FCB group bacterium]|nr:threonylcarbamoyl-AMP synthase [FCB group bacterium]